MSTIEGLVEAAIVTDELLKVTANEIILGAAVTGAAAYDAAALVSEAFPEGGADIVVDYGRGPVNVSDIARVATAATSALKDARKDTDTFINDTCEFLLDTESRLGGRLYEADKNAAEKRDALNVGK